MKIFIILIFFQFLFKFSFLFKFFRKFVYVLFTRSL